MLIHNNQQPGIRKHTIKKEITFGPLSLRFITIIIIAALCILYLAQSTQGATKNYELRELEQKKNELTKENERLQIEATRLQALKAIDNNSKEDKEQEKELVTDDNPEYME